MEPRHVVIFVVAFAACAIYYRFKRKKNGGR